VAAGFAVLGAGPALAQYGPYGPIMRPMMPIAGMPGAGVVGMVREMGLDPIGLPARSGNFYIQRAADYYGRPMRVIVDARRAQVVSVEAINLAGSIHAGPYAAAHTRYAPGAYGPGGYPGYGGPEGEDVDGLPAPPAARPAPRADLGAAHTDPGRAAQPTPFPQQGAPKAMTKSAAVSPARPPVPRKRPATAPQETAGATEPLRSGSEAASAPNKVAAPAAAIEAKPSAPAISAAPATPAMPPVAPLE